MFRFQLTTSLCYGPDSLSALSALAGRRVLIVTDAFLAGTELMSQVRAALGGATIEVFDKVLPNPDVAAISAALRCYLAFGPEAIVALGGGSPIDTAKAVRKLALEQGHRAEAGFYAIPTTSGTGSEVTSFAVVTDSHHQKLPLTSSDMLPDVAILDPDAVRTAPPKLVADSGMDAVSHAIEAYVAVGHNDFSDALAEKAVRIADTYLLRSYRSNSDVKAREHQHTGATMAGIAFQNAGLGIVHGLSHAIGGTFAVAHGRLNGILIPHVIALNAGELGTRPTGEVTDVGRRYVSLARALGLSASSDRNLVLALVGWVERLRRELEMPANVTAAGVDAAEFAAAIPTLAATAARDFCTSGNPIPVTVDDLAGILRRIV